MRWLVVALALLAGLKVWIQDSIYRDGAAEAVLYAFRERAAAACQRQPRADAGEGALDWRNADRARLVIGNSALGVRLWQVDHPQWRDRFKRPYLVLEMGAGTRTELSCTFDIAAGSAEIQRM